MSYGRSLVYLRVAIGIITAIELGILAAIFQVCGTIDELKAKTDTSSSIIYDTMRLGAFINEAKTEKLFCSITGDEKWCQQYENDLGRPWTVLQIIESRLKDRPESKEVANRIRALLQASRYADKETGSGLSLIEGVTAKVTSDYLPLRNDLGLLIHIEEHRRIDWAPELHRAKSKLRWLLYFEGLAIMFLSISVLLCLRSAKTSMTNAL